MSRNRQKQADVTEYARQIGYTGHKAVIVSDGKVISHMGQDWFKFCDRLRHNAERHHEQERA